MNAAACRRKIAAAVVDGIFCKLKEMGIWTGDAIDAPAASADIPTVYTREDVCRVACEFPGVYVPEDRIGTRVEEGQVLGTVIDALEGAARETVKAPCAGLVFSQRSYSSVYPGTLIARIRKERA
ncbi:MAG: succinylglutamate desuccinylase/aspartoacylase family protein [Christensenellales bacterium]